MKGNQLREKLRRGERVYGTHITSLFNPNAALIAGGMNMDFAFFCTEHLPMDRNEISLLCHFYAARCGVSPIVRVPNANPTAVAMALDAGAEGIIVPYVETAEEVRQVAGAVRYRPLKGAALQEALADPASLSPAMQDYFANFNAQTYLIIGVESGEAIENLDKLIAASNPDGVFLGPHDISVSLGIPEDYENPIFIDAVEDVILRCRKHSVGVGMHYPLMRLKKSILQRYLTAGMNWIVNGTDVTVLRDAMNSQLDFLRSINPGSHIDGEEEATLQTTRTLVQSCIN